MSELMSTYQRNADGADKPVENNQTPRSFSRGHPRHSADWLSRLEHQAADSLIPEIAPAPARVGIADRSYLHTVTSFSGADLIIEIDGQAIGEAQSISFTESFSEGSLISGHIITTVFDRDTPAYDVARRRAPVTIRLRQANEFGQRAERVLENVMFTDRVGGVSVDDVFEAERYNFTAESIRRITNF